MTYTTELFSGAVPLALFLAKATLLLVVALVATIPLRRATAGARHLVWLAALVGVLALPLLSRISALRVGLLPSSLAAADGGAAPAVVLAERSSVRVAAGSAPVVAPNTGTPSRRSLGAPAEHGAASLLPLLSTLEIIAIVWAGVAIALLGWLAAGALTVRRIVQNARELTTPDWVMPLCEVADRLDLEAPPRLVMSDRIEMAFACRALAPTVVLPASADAWTDDRRRAVLFHELAHVKRHDLLGHTLGRVACALYWFHPLVWTAARRLRAESERACDDLVLTCGARASEYAQHLLDMVTSVRNHGAPVMALPMARKKEFEGRMLAILDPAIRRTSPGRGQAAAVVATVGVLSVLVAAVAPANAAAASAAPASTAASASSGAADAEAAAQPDVVAEARADARVDARAGTPTDAPAERALPVPRPSASPAVAVNGQASRALADGAQLVANVTVSAVMRALGLDAAGLAHQGTDTARAAMLARVLGTDGDATVRRTAAWGLAENQTVAGRAALIKALRSDADARVREMAAWALSEYSSDDAAAALADALRDRSPSVRRTAAWAAGERGDHALAGDLESLASDQDPEVRHTAIWALGQLDLRKAPPLVVNALTDRSSEVRRVAAWTLGTIGDASAARAIASAFGTETDSDVRLAELWALGSMDQMPQSVLDIALKSNDADLRKHAVAMLAGSSGAWPWPWPWPWPRPFP